MIKPVRSFVRAEAEGNQRISAHSSLARWPVPLPPVGGFAAGECLHRRLCSVPSPGFMPFPTGPPPLSRLEMGNTLADLRSPFTASCNCKAICRARHRRGSDRERERITTKIIPTVFLSARVWCSWWASHGGQWQQRIDINQLQQDRLEMRSDSGAPPVHRVSLYTLL